VPTATALGTGTLTIQLGEWNVGMTAFTAGLSTPVSVTIAGEDNLTTIASKINSANAGVTATVLKDATGERLLLRSKDTGAEQGFRIQVADGDGNNTDNLGLSRLAFDPENGTAGATLTQQARNAEAVINGVDVISASNTLVDTIPGVTLNLLKESAPGATTEVTLATDTATMKKNILDFVAAYNALNKTLSDATKYDAETKVAGVLQGDSTTVGLKNALRSVLGSNAAEGGAFTRLADIGLDVKLGGDIVVNNSKLDKALQDPASLKKLFAEDTGNAATNGFGLKIKDFTAGLLADSGVVSTKSKALKSAIDRNGKDQDKVNDRADLMEKRLRAQYTALDLKMGSLTSLSTFINQQVAQWNKG
jgi:flagellar hook-associated protein 2